MHRFIVLFLTLALTFGLGLHDAEAKRLGGGKSSGMQRQTTPPGKTTPQQQQQAQRQQSTQQQPAAAQPQQSRWRSWLGPVAGLAAGLGLGALMSHLGMGAGAGNFLMLLLLAGGAFLLIRWFMARRAPSRQPMQYAGVGAHGGTMPGAPPPPPPMDLAPEAPAVAAPDTAGAAIPADFDIPAFTRQAKQHFIRLQAAFDAGDLNDLRDFTTPEMFAEAKLELDERGGKKQRTEVVLLNAEVVDYARDERRVIVSVRFHGLLREDSDESTPFDEVWHIVRALDNSHGWVVAGIQQPV